MVDVRRYDDPLETEVVYISPMVAAYNAANLDHGDAITEAGWYANGEGPYETEAEVVEAYDLSEHDYDYIE